MVKKNQKARNERERKRVHQVNHGFDILRDRLQPKTHTKKWSKADTLREAVKYIQQLQHLLNNEQNGVPTSSDFQLNQMNPMTSTNFSHFPIKDEFSVYLPQSYQGQGVSGPSFNTTSSPTSSVSSSYSPTSSSQMCYQNATYSYHHQ